MTMRYAHLALDHLPEVVKLNPLSALTPVDTKKKKGLRFSPKSLNSYVGRAGAIPRQTDKRNERRTGCLLREAAARERERDPERGQRGEAHHQPVAQRVRGPLVHEERPH